VQEEDLFHVYPILLNLPEADVAWRKIGEMLKE
jgi:hypothetical protein